MRMPFYVLLNVGFALMLGSRTLSAAPLTTAETLVERSRPSLVQIHIVEKSSGVLSTIGSGFIVNPQGHMVTNYEVVAGLIFDPDIYRGEVVYHNGKKRSFKLRNVDLVHGLSVIEAGQPSATYLTLQHQIPKAGEPLYALGVDSHNQPIMAQGTFDGILQNVGFNAIRFEGTLVDGMNGGPLLSLEGAVVGVNSGMPRPSEESSSFSVLASARQALILLKRPPVDPALLRQTLANQASAHQARIFSALFQQPLPTTLFQGYRTPVLPQRFAHCGVGSDTALAPHIEKMFLGCTASEPIFFGSGELINNFRITHNYLRSSRLDRFRFYAYYQRYFEEMLSNYPVELSAHAGRYVCTTGFVQSNAVGVKAVFCTRAYRRFPLLYDMALITATLNQNHAGLISQFEASGLSFAYARALARNFLSQLSGYPKSPVPLFTSLSTTVPLGQKNQ